MREESHEKLLLLSTKPRKFKTSVGKGYCSPGFSFIDSGVRCGYHDSSCDRGSGIALGNAGASTGGSCNISSCDRGSGLALGEAGNKGGEYHGSSISSVSLCLFLPASVE